MLFKLFAVLSFFVTSSYGSNDIILSSKYVFKKPEALVLQKQDIAVGDSSIDKIRESLDLAQTQLKIDGDSLSYQQELVQSIKLSLKAGKRQDAESFLVQSLAFNNVRQTAEFEVWNNVLRSILLLQKDELLTSYKFFKEALLKIEKEKLSPVPLIVFQQLARYYMLVGDLNEAESVISFMKMRKTNDAMKSLEINLLLAELKFEQGLYEEANYVLDEIYRAENLKEFPVLHSLYWSSVGFVKLALQDSTQAKTAFLKSKELNKQFDYSFTNASKSLALSSLCGSSDSLLSNQLFAESAGLPNVSFISFHSNFLFQEYLLGLNLPIDAQISSLKKIEAKNIQFLEKRALLLRLIKEEDSQLIRTLFLEKSAAGPSKYVLAPLFLLLIVLLLFALVGKNGYLSSHGKKSMVNADTIKDKIVEVVDNLTPNRGLINATLEKPLNETDWKILGILNESPLTTNKDISQQVDRSIEGVSSSLRKMYGLFEINQSSNKKVALKEKIDRLVASGSTLDNF